MRGFHKIWHFLFRQGPEQNDFYFAVKDFIGFPPKNMVVYERAFMHKSESRNNNERLEFLGDSILDAVISDVIYKSFPLKDEGELSKLRAKVVSRNTLNMLGNKLNLLPHIKYKTGTKPDQNVNIEGNCLEALIGAVYIDLGYDSCKKFILQKLIHPYIDWKQMENMIIDYKSLLYNYAQKNNIELKFAVLDENLNDAENRFHVAVLLNNKLICDAFGKSKKHAEQRASKHAIEKEKITV